MTMEYEPSWGITPEQYEEALTDWQRAAIADQEKQAWLRANEPWRYTAEEIQQPANLWGDWFDPNVTGSGYAAPLPAPITEEPEKTPFQYSDDLTIVDEPQVTDIPITTIPTDSGSGSGMGIALALLAGVIAIGLVAKK